MTKSMTDAVNDVKKTKPWIKMHLFARRRRVRKRKDCEKSRKLPQLDRQK